MAIAQEIAAERQEEQSGEVLDDNVEMLEDLDMDVNGQWFEVSSIRKNIHYRYPKQFSIMVYLKQWRSQIFYPFIKHKYRL